jgi:hypothetical protein
VPPTPPTEPIDTIGKSIFPGFIAPPAPAPSRSWGRWPKKPR